MRPLLCDQVPCIQMIRVTLAAIGMACAFPNAVVGELSDPAQIRYGMVFDAGSTGTRLHTFKMKGTLIDPPMEIAADSDGHVPVPPQIPYELVGYTVKKVKPGLSSYKNDPSQGAKSIHTHIKRAMEVIPE